MFPLLRPGERGARVGAAEWQAEEARRRVAAAEWALTRSIHVAYEEVRASEVLLSQTQALTEVAESTNDYFKRARDAGAATGIQANLALGGLQAIRLDAVRAEGRVRQARQALNALLGLPPTVELPLGPGADPSVHEALGGTPDELTRQAVERRPDLAVEKLFALVTDRVAGKAIAKLAVGERLAAGRGVARRAGQRFAHLHVHDVDVARAGSDPGRRRRRTRIDRSRISLPQALWSEKPR